MSVNKMLLVFVSWTLIMLPSVQTKSYCEVRNLREGLKYEGRFAIVEEGYSIDAHCYGIYKDAGTVVRCLSEGQWSEELPLCEIITCPVPDRMAIGSFAVGLEIGEKAIFKCPEGFWFDGTNPRVCQANGKWSGKEGQCLAVQCPSLPPPFDGKFNDTPPFRYHTFISVSCDTGYVYTGSKELFCQGNNTWDGRLGECIEISSIHCKTDQLCEDAVVSPKLEVGRYGDQVSLECPKGLAYNGTAMRSCQADGTWSGTSGTCNVLSCLPPEEFYNIETGLTIEGVIHTRKHQINIKDTMYQIGDTVRLTCHEGYTYIGAGLTCSEDGEWGGTLGFCKAIPCLFLPEITNGDLDGTWFVYMDEGSIFCDTGFIWDGEFPQAVCTSDGLLEINGECKVVQCTEDPHVGNGAINGSSFVYMDEANIICNSGHRWKGSYPQAVCTINGSWEINGECKESTGEEHALTIVLPLTFIICGLLLVILIWQRNRQKRRHQRPEDHELSEPLLQEKGNESNSLKSAILQTGHVISRNPDKRIDLDTEFVKLRLVTGGRYDRMDEINDLLPHRYQDYLQRTLYDNIEMEDILKHMKYETQEGTAETGGVRQRKALLMEGRAGVGKSTLVQKMMRLWAQNIWAKDFKAAFLFNIRNLTVLDKRKISLVKLFQFFSVYSLREGAGNITLDMLKDDEDRILIFLDGIDEFPGLQEKLEYPKSVSLTDDAEPIEWCINLLKRNIMGKSALILASRPYKDLKHLRCSPVMEVVGLTQETILNFIDHHVALPNIDRVRDAMTSNPLVMSVSSITYFCLMFTTVLEEDEEASTTELTTYTRIASFFTKHYMSRCPPDLTFQTQPASVCLPPLAKLAYRGLVEREQMNNRVRLVFDETDLEETGVTKPLRAVAEHSGILISSTLPSDEDKEIGQVSEFVHLSIQELLAMLELLHKTQVVTRSAAASMWSSGSFLMAQQYLFGLCYDVDSEHIQQLLKTIGGGKGEAPTRPNLIPDLISRLSKMEEGADTLSKLQAIQMVYETQRPDLAKDVSQVLYDESKDLLLNKTLLTLVDINATIFILRETDGVCNLRLENVTMDANCEKVLAESLNKCPNLRGFSLRETKLSPRGMERLMNGLPRSDQINKLMLEHVALDEDSEEELVNTMKEMSNITKLSFEGSRLSSKAVESILTSLEERGILRELNLAKTGLTDVKQVVGVLNIKTLTSLNLKDNTLSWSTVDDFAMGVKTHTSLQYLSLMKTGVNKDLAETLISCVKENKSLKTLDVRGKMIKCDMMKELKDNETLDFIWLTDNDDETQTLMIVPDKGHRLRVNTGESNTHIYAWSPEDIITSNCLHHDCVVWGEEGGKLTIQAYDEYTDLYGKERPAVSAETWDNVMNHVTSSKHRVGELGVWLSESSALTPLLFSLTHDTLLTLIHSKVEMVWVFHGDIELSDLHTWLDNLTSQSGWSFEAHVEGAKMTHEQGQLVIQLRGNRVITSSQQLQQKHEHYLVEVIKVLEFPDWFIPADSMGPSHT